MINSSKKICNFAPKYIKLNNIMVLKSISVENFRSFKKFSMNLAPKVSVLIGKNGAGKSSILQSIIYALNFLFSSEESLGDTLIISGNPDLQMESMTMDEFYRKSFDDNPESYANIHCEADYLGKDLKWDIYKRAVSGQVPIPDKYAKAYNQFVDTYKKEGVLPVLAFFSDSFPHKESDLSDFVKNQIASQEQVIPNFGYVHWSKEYACTHMWQYRWVNAIAKDVQLQYKDKFSHDEAGYVTQKMIEFSKPIHDECSNEYEIETMFFGLKDNIPQMWLRLKSGRDIDFNHLPAGYARIYSIVIDICYRFWILNRDITKEPMGVVMIDEIDLHLHPTLAVEVVERLTRLFPKIQFILTTHSPLIVSNIPTADGQSKIYRILNGETEPHVLPDIYGIDYNTTLLDVMDSSVGSEIINYLVETLLRNMRQGNEKLVEKRKAELKKLVSSSRYNDIIKSLEDQI